MAQQVRIFTVFIASPSDLVAERESLRDVVERLNATISKETDLRIELLGWEDTLPGRGRPQALINADLDKADLFVGCVWKKMGSPAAGLGSRTGFEEEFYRALERNAQTNSPEIWMFFKEVDTSDPGEQLQRVLTFRREQVEAKQILFKEFKQPADWAQLLHEFLLRRILKLITVRETLQETQSAVTAQSQVKVASDAGKDPSVAKKVEEVFAQLASMLEKAAKNVRSGDLLSFDKVDALQPLETARLLLFAATHYDWNTAHVQLGAHECNSVYWHREELKISAKERLFLMRTVLLDRTHTKPGWFWLDKWSLAPSALLSYLALNDSYEWMRKAAILFAKRTGVWLKEGRSGQRRLVSILGDKSEIVRLAGIDYMAALGKVSEIRCLEHLFGDASSEVRSQAEQVIRLIKIREDPDSEFRRGIQQADLFDDRIIEELSRAIGRVRTETLTLALSHSSGQLRTFSARELFARKAITEELSKKLCLDPAKSVKEFGYRAKVLHNQPINLGEVRKELERNYLLSEPSWNRADVGAVVNAVFAHATVGDLWGRVNTFDRDSPAALLSLGRNHFHTQSEEIRKNLSDGFRGLAAAAKRQKSESFLESLLRRDAADPFENTRVLLVDAAIQVLAEHPNPQEVGIYIESLSSDLSKVRQTLACLRALGEVGTPAVSETLKPFVASELPGISVVAIATYYKLAPNKIIAAKEILSEISIYRVWMVVMFGLRDLNRGLWEILEPLLARDDDDIRRVVSYYATETLSQAELLQYLSRYQKNRYFYNVVVALDRAGYAPREFWSVLQREEWEYLKKWEISGYEMPKPRARRGVKKGQRQTKRRKKKL